MRYTLLPVSRKTNTKAKKHQFPVKTIRPNAFDLAALDILTKKHNMKESHVWRQGLARLVDFEGVRDQVTELAAQYA